MDYVTPILNAASSVRAKGDLNARRMARFRTFENPYGDEMQAVYTPINGLKLTSGYPPKSYYVIAYVQIVGNNGVYLCSDGVSSYDVLSDLFWVDKSGRRNAWTKASELDDMVLMAIFRNDKAVLKQVVSKALKT